jgi:hypothetical protein
MKQPIFLPHDPAPALRVLGADVRFLCEGKHTETAFSLMEVLLPKDAGPHSLSAARLTVSRPRWKAATLARA